MNLALWSSALLMGLLGSPHCLVMCGGACAAIAGRCGGARPARALLAWQAGRALAYAAAGAAVAGSVGLLAQWGHQFAWLRPWWMLLHAAALALGLWMAWHGRAPAWLSAPLDADAPPEAAARRRGWPVLAWAAAAPATAVGGDRAGSAGTTRRSSASGWHAGVAGLAWGALPCGLLHVALLSASLGSSAVDGAIVMLAFALGSGLGLWFGPRLWIVLSRGFGGHLARRPVDGPALATRLAGTLLAIGALWALRHTALVPLIEAFC